MNDKKSKYDIAQEMASLKDSNQSNDSAVDYGKQDDQTAVPAIKKPEGDEIKAHCGMTGNKRAVVVTFTGYHKCRGKSGCAAECYHIIRPRTSPVVL